MKYKVYMFLLLVAGTSVSAFCGTDAGDCNCPNGILDCSAASSSLENINVANQNITSIKSGTFSRLTNLTVLVINYNGLTSIENGLFSGLTKLTDLSLNENNLSSIANGVFSGLSSLTYLNLNRNRLTSMGSSLFSGLTSLLSLDLSGNLIKSIFSGLFDALTSLVNLYLNSNEITILENGVFNKLTRLVTLFLSTNQLVSIDVIIFSGLTNLTNLYLQDNKFNCDCNMKSIGQLVAYNNTKEYYPAFCDNNRIEISLIDDCSPSSSNPLTPAVIAGIVVGVVGFCILILVLRMYFMRK